ncbi:protein kinase [Ophiostoma piceae UAMH 11346]|uniref:Protein kinase n=1 Tax=Ophiostoma piceae (strain UAMH 11346) TaxID=1262450 RepID=S3CJV0_OPHP1|nr:protein kinase [Ophiostoma piceae UAMH 11346]
MGKSKEDKENKEWHLQAQRYILDPLTAPEPNQLDGPGSSFFNPHRSLSLNYKQDIPPHVLQLRDQLKQNGHPNQIHHPKPRNPGRRHSFLPPTDGPPANTVLTRSQSLNPSAQRPSHRTRSHSVTSIPSTTADSQLPYFEVSALQQKIIRPNEPNRTKEATSHKKGPARPSNPKEVQPSSKSDKSGNSKKSDKSGDPEAGKPVKSEKPKSPEGYKRSKKPKETIRTPVPAPAPSPASFPADTKASTPSITPTSRSRPSKKEKKTPPLSSQNESRLRNPIPASPRSSIKSLKKPPQTHHTQGTAGILNDILADRTSHHVNRSPKSPPPAPRPPTTKPSLRRTGSFIQKPSGEMTYQPPSEQTKMMSPQVGRASSNASKHSVSPMQSGHSRPPSYTSRTPSRAPSEAGSVSTARAPPVSGSNHTARAPSVAGSVAPSRAPSVSSSKAPSVSGSAAPGPSSGSKSERHSSSRRKSRAPKPGRPFADIIDRLDQSGPAYHHGGPYDATLASVNVNKKKSPLEAVKESNLEALKATPREYIHDSLTKHVPLQGTAIVPPGMADWNGQIMDYKEGADLMREPDAAGGAYKRYDCFDYHPDDLKGKGESYLVEKAEKENKAKLRKQGYKLGRRDSSSYELQDQRRRRSNDESSAPLLSPKDDHLQTPIRMHRHSSAGPSSQQSRHSESRRSERSQSHHSHRSYSQGHQGTSDVPRTASVSSNVSPLSPSHSVRRKEVGSPNAASSPYSELRAELQGVSRTEFPVELSGESFRSYRSELQDRDTDHGRSRSNSAGQRIADGLKRHLGSLRRK